MARFLVTADWHAGAGTEYGRAPYGPGSRLADQEQAFTAIADLAIRENVDAVLFAGDLTHHNHPSASTIQAVARPLRKLRGHIPVVAISGNVHDVAHTDEPIILELFDDTLHLHRRPGITKIVTGHTAHGERIHTHIACLPWAPPSRLAAASEAGGRADVHALMAEHLVAVAAGMRAQINAEDEPLTSAAILMLHYSVAGGQSASGMDAALFNETVLPLAELQAQGWDAVVCGHLHRYQVLSTDPLVLYPGPPAIVDFGEAGYEHGCVLLDLDDQTGGVAHRFIEIPGRRFLTIDCDLTREPPQYRSDELRGSYFTGMAATIEDEIREHITTPMNETYFDDAVVRLRYTCTPEQARAINPTAIRHALLDAGAHTVRIDPPTLIRTDRGRLDEILDAVWDDASETRKPSAAGLAPLDAVEAWIAAQGIEGDLASALRIKTAAWLDAAATREPQEAAA